MTTENKIITAIAPGRINLIGEHTDYNNGFVMPAAIDKKTTCSVSLLSKVDKCKLSSKTFDNSVFEFDLNNIKPLHNRWENYVLGVINQLQQLGAKLSPFKIEIESNVPLGAGLSSSAALECCVAKALNSLFNLSLDDWQLIKICQKAEHTFTGTMCGIMDQFASIKGKQNHLMLLDCKSLAYQYLPFDLGNFQLVLLNTNVSHQLASSEYNLRRKACEDGINILQKTKPKITSLRAVSYDLLIKHKAELGNDIFNKCQHVVLENQRVLDAKTALLQKNFNQVGELMYQSHNSLRNLYEVSCEELNFLVDKLKANPNVLGSRMMGGGFGGCTINIIHKNESDKIIEQTNEAYYKTFNKNLSSYIVKIGAGATIIDE